MKRKLLLVTCLSCLLWLLQACCTCRSLTSSETETNRDSIQIEYRERTVYVPDTVFWEIPVQTAERTTADSLSHLENDYVMSDARINQDGTLFHSLITKPQTKSVPTQHKVVIRDSIIYKNRYVDREKVVVKKMQLTFFQKMQIWGCRGFLVAVVLLYVIKIFRTHIRRISYK
jgi:hypothetical protein